MRESVCIVLHHSCLFRLTMPTSNLLSPLFQPNRQETHIHCQGNVCNISKKRKRINQIPESKSQSTEQIKIKNTCKRRQQVDNMPITVFVQRRSTKCFDRQARAIFLIQNLKQREKLRPFYPYAKKSLREIDSQELTLKIEVTNWKNYFNLFKLFKL